MGDNRKDKIRFLKNITAIIFILTGLITTSEASAQWPPYSNSILSSGSFVSPAFSLFNPSYGNYPPPASYPGLWSRGFENYGNYSYNDIFSPYSNRFLTSGSFGSPAFSEFNSPGVNFSSRPASPLYPEALYGGPYEGYRISSSFIPNMFNPYISNIPNPYTSTPVWHFPWSPTPGFTPPSFPSFGSPFGAQPMYGVGRIFRHDEPEPSRAPEKMPGEWQSQQLTDEDGNKIKGNLECDRGNDLLKMLDSSLPLDEGELTEFEYTPTFGEAPISFEGVFDSGYTAYFSGTADNDLCPRGTWCEGGGYFDVEGTYEIKDNEGQIVDRGTFSLSYFSTYGI